MMAVRKFAFPSFEKWNEDRQWSQKIGNFSCSIMQTGTVKEGHRISARIYTLNISNILYKSAEILENDTHSLKRWYEKATAESNKEWERYIVSTYCTEKQEEMERADDQGR